MWLNDFGDVESLDDPSNCAWWVIALENDVFVRDVSLCIVSTGDCPAAFLQVFESACSNMLGECLAERALVKSRLGWR